MEERYIAPNMEIICLECQDVITGSNETPFVPFNVNEVESINETW